MAYIFLIVDDDENSLQVAQQALQLNYPDAQCHVARSGAECLRTLRRVAPDAILLDLHLPELDGWQTLQSIRAMPSLAAIPVIAMTAYHSANVAHDASQAGFNGYVAKPVDLELFGQTVEELIG